ncbi:MAG TPA: hypothetical protein VGD08_11630 [Stellaceae bacterium]|jgi:mRNA interferase RelE/StbE
MEIVYLRDARNALKRLPVDLRRKFLRAFEAIAAGEARELDVKPLTGRSENRLLIGGFRAIFEMDDGRLIVMLIGPRGDVYKKMREEPADEFRRE